MSKTVLVVEDDPDLRFLYVTALHGREYTVLEAKTNAEASAILEDSSVMIDLAILDMAMPDIPGTRIVEIIRNHERFPNIPIIVITANEHYQERLGDKVDRFFLKPVAISDVVDSVSELVN
ncbi:MAG: response regulator [Anaerolineae bacterium]|nr:response regulator [Anaerolineae bacterium]